MPENYFDAPIATTYEAKWSELFDPAVVGPVVRFLADLADGGATLELGIRTGRIAIPLRQQGVLVHGIDLSPDMFAQLRAKQGTEDIGVTIGDFATTSVEGTFALAYLVRNTIMNLTSQEQQGFLLPERRRPSGAGRVLCDRGRGSRAAAAATGREGPGIHRDPNAPGLRRVRRRLQGLVSHHYWVVDGQLETRSVPFRYVWPSELDLMAQLAGMRLRERWSDWTRAPFTSDSRTHVSVWQRTTA